MPDIAMCKNEDCALRHSCYRFTAAPNPYQQAYANFSPLDLNGAVVCTYWVDNAECPKT